MPAANDNSIGYLSGPEAPRITTPVYIYTRVDPEENDGKNFLPMVSITGIAKALVWRFSVQGHGGSVTVSSRPGGAGRIMLQATGIETYDYTISWPWMYEADTDTSDEEPAMHITCTEYGYVSELRFERLNWERP